MNSNMIDALFPIDRHSVFSPHERVLYRLEAGDRDHVRGYPDHGIHQSGDSEGDTVEVDT